MIQPFSSTKESSFSTVLVVDDNRDVVEILSLLLSRYGLTVLRAFDGRECLEAIRSRPVDLVILDVMMPEMDGLQVCAELKRTSRSLPVILLTAKDDMATRAAAMALGVSDFVAKPVNNRDLLARVATQLRSHRLEMEMDRVSAGIKQPSANPPMKK